MSLEGIKDWIVDQVEILLIIGFIILVIVAAYKRAWIMLGATIIGFAVIGIFVTNPNILLDLSEWINDRVNIGGDN
ncbi:MULTISPECIES: hypothetical protein [Oceanobacillus]|uniref:hypothetical protein n=1 Tax=Oceanobacillus TaxID=182709 RepID=UPI000595B44C|nr:MULTISPECIES: hypothetical protein [Oceanobacillus]